MSVPDVSGAAIANLEVETLQHKNPTFHGDTIYAETRVLDVKESASRPDRGIVTVETKGLNQDGVEVCYFRRRVMIWKRDAAPKRQRPYDGTDDLGARDDRPPRSGAGLQRRRRRLRPGPAVVSRRGRRPRRARARPRPPGGASLDLGAGTGKFTELLLGSGAEVVAVEPVAEMRAKLVAALPEVDGARRHQRGHPPRRPLGRRASSSAQAFHWFDPGRAVPEIVRVLRPGGGLALVWNQRDESVPWVAELSQGHRVERRRRPTSGAPTGPRSWPAPPAIASRRCSSRTLPLRAARRPRDAARPRPLDQLPGRRPARAPGHRAGRGARPRRGTSPSGSPSRTAPTCGSVT